jgi:hypothetical protein
VSIGDAGKVATAAVTAMQSTPLALALLFVNVGFIGFASYILGEVATNASERNKAQIELIGTLVKDIRDCRQGPRPTGNRSIMFRPAPGIYSPP